MKAIFEQEDVVELVKAMIAELKPLITLRPGSINDCWMSREEAATLLGVKPRWFETNTEKLGIPQYKIGGHKRYKKSDLIKWGNKQRIPER